MNWIMQRTRKRQRGQTIVIVTLAMLVLLGFAGLAIDGGHLYLVRRNAQNATDAAALAAGRALVINGNILSGPPAGGSSSDAAKAAHHLATANGFRTILNNTCDQGASQFSTSWFDQPVGGCTDNNFNTRVTVYSPPTTPLPPDCQPAPWNCFQVVITQRVPSFLMGVLGIPVTTTTTTATVFAQPAGPLIGTPPPTALYLYEPAKPTCSAQQCFDPTKAPGRAFLSCDEAGENCPTFWSRPGSNPLIAGVDGTLVNGRPNPVAMESNGVMVLQADTTICNPTGSATPCSPAIVLGTNGFAIAPGATLFCSQFVGSSTPTGCTQAPQTNLGRIFSNEVPFYSQLWTPRVNPPALRQCGSLVLNGQSLIDAGNPCASSAEPYSIQPGQYSFIVINHGTYQFESGFYLITDQAFTSGAIDHSNETAVADWDLCPGVLGTNSCSATAGIWIGHGSGSFGPYVAPTPGLCTDFSSPGGGGDATIVSGTGVTFKFTGRNGFVSTHEVASINLTGPGLGATLNTTGGAPLLFDLENKGFIHLDAAPWDSSVASSPSGFTGIIYQNPNQTAGGVELNPGLGSGSPALSGQVLAYTFTSFGTAGPAIDFSKGWGTASTPTPTTAGNDEPEILGQVTYVASLPAPNSGMAQLQITYRDEWALDAYNAYIKVNNDAPVFFSQGIWSYPSSATLPPPGNNPGDNFPAYPGNEGAGQYLKTATSPVPDWTYLFNNDGSGRRFRIAGNWTWGHEQSIPGARTKPQNGNRATLTYTFPSPPGQTVNVTIFMSDGDSCGDFVTANVTASNAGSPNAGQQSSGSVSLVR